jgi:chromosome segregation protein
MRLQRLQIAGFKSFSDRSELAFDEGVTAIVGPNGCGKSNVADAITWVLGEQSAKSLRGDKMEDVIFNGSDARKPTGSAEVRLRLAGVTSIPAAVSSLAEEPHTPVNGTNGANGHALVLEQDGDSVTAAPLSAREVEVVRRLYRSGESEYLIDGQVCRLKDVHELLMDTGLGAKAYAIIEQGKIGMILSSRPADRRQLIEEAAGITKYKARRRAAELKLDAAQQNLTRIDDIVFEVEKQRGTLKRQAAKARRYRRLRDEMRRWEKVLFAGRFRELRAAIEGSRARLADARTREAAAAARVAEMDGTLGRLRIELAEAESRAAAVRESTHSRELETQRRQQQIEFDRQQIATLGGRVSELDGELASLEARREPGRVALEERRTAAASAGQELEQATAALAAEQEAWQAAVRVLEGLEGDVEAARGEVFAAINAATALRHAIAHATTARERVGETLGRLEIEEGDLAVEREALNASRIAAAEALSAAQAALESTRTLRASHEAALAAARSEHETLARDLRTREHDLAALTARLRSLEELDAARAGYGDAARVVLAQANGAVNQMGAVADYLDVERGHERAVESLLGDLLQHVIVPSHEHAAAGLQLVRAHQAGRCGFVVLDSDRAERPSGDPPTIHGLQALRDVVRVTGPHAAAISQALGQAWIAPSFDDAVTAARENDATVATLQGDVVRGRHLVFGGEAAESRGILAMKGEIRDARDRMTADREAAQMLAARVSGVEHTIHELQQAIETATLDLHRHEKAIVGHEAQLARAAEEHARIARTTEMLALDRRRAEEEGSAIDERQAEARESLGRLEEQQREADARLSAAQRRLSDARDTAERANERVADARASHARLIERSAALSTEVTRLEDAARELDERVENLHGERAQKLALRESLTATITSSLAQLDEDVRALEELRASLAQAEDAVTERNGEVETHDVAIRSARESLDSVRGEAGALEVACATAESDLGHLSAQCLEVVDASLDAVLEEVEQLEREGAAVPDARAIAGADEEEAAEDAADGESLADPAAAAGFEPVEATPPASLTAEGAIAALKAKIDRLGPVNMMAIEQFEELETRHQFLTTQRKDLVDSITQTGEAIKRIDETSKARFREAFTAINRNFQLTFSTLFGGGRAGITLLDETDPLESGIDIVASPPGKRLQSVQLLSGGEKALTAIALMFAIFQYKPSPFCLLDEIDAPLDDANIGRFIEMLKGMLHHTQFILITHNRKTMEIADRLYGVTMEEPGVSKLISVRLN